MRKDRRHILPAISDEDIKNILIKQLNPRNITKTLLGVDVIDALQESSIDTDKPAIDITAVINKEYLCKQVNCKDIIKKVDTSDFEYDEC
jgi:hypothetical protein